MLLTFIQQNMGVKYTSTTHSVQYCTLSRFCASIWSFHENTWHMFMFDHLYLAVLTFVSFELYFTEHLFYTQYGIHSPNILALSHSVVTLFLVAYIYFHCVIKVDSIESISKDTSFAW